MGKIRRVKCFAIEFYFFVDLLSDLLQWLVVGFIHRLLNIVWDNRTKCGKIGAVEMRAKGSKHAQ